MGAIVCVQPNQDIQRHLAVGARRHQPEAAFRVMGRQRGSTELVDQAAETDTTGLRQLLEPLARVIRQPDGECCDVIPIRLLIDSPGATQTVMPTRGSSPRAGSGRHPRLC